MRSRSLLPLLLALLVVTSGLAVAKARGEPELSVFAPQNEFTPGEDADLELFIQNAGDVAYATSPAEQARVTTARDVVVEVDDEDVPIDVEAGTKPVGNVPEGVSPAIPMAISVDDDAETDEYRLPVTVEYKYTNVIGSVDGAYDESEATLRTSITVVVEDDARFRITDSSAEDLFGTSGPISLTIENVGSDTARNANVAIQSGSEQLTFGNSQTAGTFVGNWAPGETREVTVEGTLAEGADRRNYPLSATVSYDSADQEPRESGTLKAGVTPRVESRFGLSGVESSLVVGEEGVVSGTVVNNGGSTVRDAVLVLSADTGNFEPVETEYSMGELPAGESSEFSFDVEVSEAAAGGPRQLSFTVRYRDESNEVVESDVLDARVDVAPQRDQFGVSTVSATLQPGESGQLSLTVTNRGDEPVSDVSAKLFANDPLSSSDDEAFIERLEPGASRTINFSVAVGGSAMEKTYPVSVDFQFDDADGDTLLSDTYQVPVQVSAPADDGGGLPLPLIGLAVVVVAAVGYLLYRRRQS